jgi:hypothetical protein
MVGTRLYIITQIKTYNYMFRPCILAIVRFIIEPDDGQYTGPKNVVVCTNLCDNI